MYRRRLGHSRVKSLFRFISVKMNTVFTVETALGFDTCFHLEYSPSVKAFEVQPKGLHYDFEGRRCPYTPDFLVIDYDGKPCFLEVKPSALVAEPDFLQRFTLKQQRAIALASPLILITEKQIRIHPILGNLKLLHRYSGFQSTTPLHRQLFRLVKEFGRVSLSHLCSSTGAPQGEVIASTLSLIARGLIKSDLTVQNFGFTSVVWAD